MLLITAGIIGDGIILGFGTIHGFIAVGDGTDHGDTVLHMDGDGIIGDGMLVLVLDTLITDMQTMDILITGIVIMDTLITITEDTIVDIMLITQAEEEVY